MVAYRERLVERRPPSNGRTSLTREAGLTEPPQTTFEPRDRGPTGKRALLRCKGGLKGPGAPEKRALLVVKGRINGPMQMKTTVVVQEGDD